MKILITLKSLSRYRIAFLILICLLTGLIKAKAQWAKLQSGSTDDYFRSVYFVSKTKGFAVGGGFISRSTIFETEDGGKTWTRTYEGTDNEAFNQVLFVNEKTGFIVGDSSGGSYPNIRKTIDGGKSWHLYTKALPNGGSFNKIYFADSLHGWIIGANMAVRCMYTTDGGQNWKQSASTVYEDNGFVYFKDNITGWVFGGESSSGAAVYKKSTDGGQSWQNAPLFSGVSGVAVSVYFPNAQTGFVTSVLANKFRLYRSTNGGQSFSQITHIPDSLSYAKMQFTSAEVGYILAFGMSKTYMLKTSDGGSNWILENTPLKAGQYLTDFNMVDDNTGFAVGGDGTILGRDINSGIAPVLNQSGIINIFPNPMAKGQHKFNLKALQPISGALRIYDMSGRLIWQNMEQKLETGNNSIVLPESDMKQGVYFICLQANDLNYTTKLILE